jgi:hypothetical protein
VDGIAALRAVPAEIRQRRGDNGRDRPHGGRETLILDGQNRRAKMQAIFDSGTSTCTLRNHEHGTVVHVGSVVACDSPSSASTRGREHWRRQPRQPQMRQ